MGYVMNYFTKEELEHLRYCVVTDIDIQEYHIDSKPNLLASKIQWMIDNYCDHEEMEFMEQKDHEMLLTCKKCMRTDLF